MKEEASSRTKPRVGIALIAVALAILFVFGGYWYGQRSVRKRYEIWWSTSGSFERESVRAAKAAAILKDYKTGQTTNSGEVLILGELRTSLGIMESFVPFASDRDRQLAARLAQSLSDQIAPFVPTNSTTYQEKHRAYIYREIQQNLDSILQKSTNGVPKL